MSEVQGVRDESSDYPATLQGYTGSQIDALAPALPHQGAFDLYASALSGATRVYSNPVSITYGPQVREYDLDGAGNRNAVETSAATAIYVKEDDAPPTDAQMNQYTTVPQEGAPRAYDENGNLRRTGAALPALYRQDYLDRIVEVVGVPALDSGSGVPAGGEFSDDFATGLDTAWTHSPAVVGGLTSAQWAWNSGGFLEHDGEDQASSAYLRTDPDGDIWWVYTRPEGATGDDVLEAHLRITGHNTDTTFNADYLRLDIDTDEIGLFDDSSGVPLVSASISTTDNTPYLIHAHLSGPNVVVRRGQLGQPLETVLVADNAPIQATDRFILSTGSACLVDDVNIGHYGTEYAYDALGRRIEKRTGGDATRYIYDGARVAEEWSIPEGGSPALAASYVYGLYVDEVLTMRRGASDYYYHGDDMHNVVKLTDSNGDVVEAYDYGDYGQPEFYDATGEPLDVTASPLGNSFLFSGREWDAELGLYFFRNRYMDPGLGRFVSRDPLGLWGDPLNLGNGYTYAASNPWSLVDPFGLCSGNSFWGNFFSALGDWETYRDYALPAYKDAALGVGDWVEEMGDLGTHLARMQIDPVYAYEHWKSTYETASVIASDLPGAFAAAKKSFSDYVSDFDARDAGKLLPDLVGAAVGLAEARAVRTAAQAVETAGDAASKVYQWTPRATPPLAAPGQDLFVGTYSTSRSANIRAGVNGDFTPHHSVQNAISQTTHGKGITINLRKDLHELTRTFKQPVQSGLNLRQHLARDIMDMRNLLLNAGYNRSMINPQLQELIRQNKVLGGLNKK